MITGTGFSCVRFYIKSFPQQELIKGYGKEKVAFTVHSCFRQFLGYAADIYHVIKQDFDYWVKEKGHIAPDIVDVYELLSSNLNDK